MLSRTDTYHITIRGVNKQQIYLDLYDNMRFLQILAEVKEISEYELYAYCLMGNHAHLILKTGKEPIDLVMKRIEVRYAIGYNKKYNRSGPVFENRFFSKPIENENYLITCFRYIHQNPLRAYIVGNLNQYQWSSYWAYKQNHKDLVDIAFMNQMLNGRDNLLRNLTTRLEPEEEKRIRRRQFTRIPDEEVEAIILATTKLKHIHQISQQSKSQQIQICKQLFQAGLTYSQISRWIGISRTTICRYMKRK